MKTTIVLAGALLASSFSLAQAPEECASKIPTAWSGPAREAAEADCAFYVDSTRRGADAWADFADEKVVTAWARGREQMRKSMSRMYENPKNSISWYPVKAETMGPFVVTTGLYKRNLADESGTMKATTGRYMTVWKRQADGTWKYVFDGGEEDENK